MKVYFGNKKAFTLIELLVVVAIISILSSIVLVSLNSARGKARDAKRKEDIHQLTLAINMYANDNNGNYPVTGGSACIGLASSQICWNAITNPIIKGNDALNTFLNPYIKILPDDPLPNRAAGDRYLYTDTFVAVGCGGTNLSGHFILWDPESGWTGILSQGNAACQGVGVAACCGNGNPCNASEGYFCALKID